jgi:hypothetical protein
MLVDTVAMQSQAQTFEVQYCDQYGAREPTATGVLNWTHGVEITGRLLIAERIRGEFDRISDRFVTHDGALPAALAMLGGNKAALTPEQAIEIALRAFSANRFFLLVERRQITDLDAPFLLKPATSVVFLRLTALTGG